MDLLFSILKVQISLIFILFFFPQSPALVHYLGAK